MRGRAELHRGVGAGADGAAIRAFVAAGARRRLAPRATTPAESEALQETRRRGVLSCSRAGPGAAASCPAPCCASEFVVADNLNPQKARVLAMLALTRTDEVLEVQRMFDEDRDERGPHRSRRCARPA